MLLPQDLCLALERYSSDALYISVLFKETGEFALEDGPKRAEEGLIGRPAWTAAARTASIDFISNLQKFRVCAAILEVRNYILPRSTYE